MKKLLLVLLAAAIFAIAGNVNADSDLAIKLKGRILLQVESKGEAWYVNPNTAERHSLGRPDDAFLVMRELGLGISNADFDSFNGHAPQRLSGKILLKVEDAGKAYYVNPVDLKMHFLGRPADAFQVMRELGLGIKNSDLEDIVTASVLDTYIRVDGENKPSDLIVYKTGGKTINLLESSNSENYDNRNGRACYEVSLNDKPVKVISRIDNKSYENYRLCGYTNKIYKTDLNNIVVFYTKNSAYEAMPGSFIWEFFDTDSQKIIATLQESDISENFSTYDSVPVYINGVTIDESKNNNGCSDEADLSKDAAENLKPTFTGFLAGKNTIYEVNNPSSLACQYFCLEDEMYGVSAGCHAWPSYVDKKILGLDYNKNIVYFSGTGKGWTAYYAYDVAQNIITETTLDNINKNKIKLTLIKSF